MPDPDQPTSLPSAGRRLRVVELHDRSGMLGRIEAAPDRLALRFSPIADVRRSTVAGYEVLLGFEDRDAVSPRSWTEDVHPDAAGRVEAVLVRRALQERERLPAAAFLAVHVSAAALSSADVAAALADGGRLERVVLVVGDEPDDERMLDLRRALDGVRGAGGLVAVDETGSGYASLRQLVALRPDYVRIGAQLVSEVDRDQAKAAVVETLGALASRIDAWVIAGGVPSARELRALRRIGVPLAQGPAIGEPAPAMEALADGVADGLRRLASPSEAAETVAALIEDRPALPWGGSLEDVADAFLEDPRHDVVVLVDERNRPLALAERAALLRGEPFERPVMRITPGSSLKAVARRAAARPLLERFHPLVACDRRGVYLGVVRVEQLLDALARD